MAKFQLVLKPKAAQQCLDFTEEVIIGTQDRGFRKFFKDQDDNDLFVKSLEDFRDYLKLMLNSGIEDIEIPEHHRKIHDVLLTTSMKQDLIIPMMMSPVILDALINLMSGDMRKNKPE